MQVMIIDNNRAIRALLRRHTHALGHASVVFGSAKDALYHLKSGGRIDAIITGLRLPDMGGPQLLERLRTDGFKGRKILCTADVSPATRLAGTRAGAHSILRKPVAVAELKIMLGARR